MKKVRFHNINWDTSDPEAGLEEIEPPELPKEVTLEVDDDLDVAYQGADCLSDEYGFCVNSFEFEEVKEA